MMINFRVGDTQYIADGSRVLSVLPIQSVALGAGLTFDLIVNLPSEGPSTQVIDMHDILRVPRREIGAQSRFIVVESQNIRVAFLVDKVDSIGTMEEQGLSRLEYRSVRTVGDAVVRDAESGNTWVSIMDFNQLIHDKFRQILRP